MTAIHSIPTAISNRFRFRSKPVKARAIKVVIPTYKDWDGLRVTLDSLLNLKAPPKQIAVANDNPDEAVPNWLSQYPVKLVAYPGNAGPARARNLAFGLADGGEIPPGAELFLGSSVINMPEESVSLRSRIIPELEVRRTDARTYHWNSEIDWIYFTDCGCTHDPDLFLKFEEAWRECGDSCVAISGPITGSGSSPINEYMTEQGILNPPLERNIHGIYLPQAIITANALIAALPFAYQGGFDPHFQEAAGEDLDMGIRLREMGVIAWAPEAKAAHHFEENDSDFYKRFRRYGRGNRKLEMKHNLPSLRARRFTPELKDNPEHVRLAKLSLEAMQAGYDEAVDESERGVLWSVGS